jgi:flavin reductase (DIM6/NTAB) family NADH-FMN oxidoreductase RutF
MQLDPNQTSTRDLYSWMVRLITPRPIAWVSTLSTDGVANLAPFSFFNGVGANPPTIMFCPANKRDGTPKDTLNNIHRSGQFVVSIVTEPLADAMNVTSAELDADIDEFELAGIEKIDSKCVSPPRVAASLAAFECELHQAIQLGSGPGGANLVIGRIVWMHVGDALFNEQGDFDADRMTTIGRMGGEDYVRTRDRFSLPRPKTPR